MSNYTTLIGADDVLRAGHNMSSASDGMRAAASHFDEALQRHQTFMDDWLYRFEAIMERAQKHQEQPKP